MSKVKALTLTFSFLAFCFGLLFGQEIFVFYSTTGFDFNISIILCVLIILFGLIFNFKKTINFYKYLSIPLYIYLAIVVVSYINSFIFFGSLEGVLISIKGTIEFGIYCVLTIVTFYILKDRIKYIMYGLLSAFILNVIISLITYFLYQATNYVVTFYYIFPLRSFYVARDGVPYLQGLFKEPAHLTSFLITSYFILNYYFSRRILLKLILFILILSTFLLSSSGNIIVFALSYLIYFAITWRYRKKVIINSSTKQKRIIAISGFGLIGVVIFAIALVMIIPTTRDIFMRAIVSINPFDRSNSERLNNMIAGFQIGISHPIGIGYNMTATAMVRYNPKLVSGATYNLILNNMIELSVIGMLIYLFVFIKPCFHIYKKRFREHEKIYLLVSIIAVLLLHFLNGDQFPIHYLALGMAMLIGKEIRVAEKQSGRRIVI